MSDKYSKSDLRHIAEEMIEDLRECEDGTVTTTESLARKSIIYNDMDDSDLFELHNSLLRAAKANKITLDMSEHYGKAEGLPFNLTYVVRNKKAQIKCPHCGSTDTARIIYGLPALNDEMQKKLDEGKWVLGGCDINTVEINGKDISVMPARFCNKCRKDFGSPPILISKKNNLAEDYRDIVKSIKFSINGFSLGSTEITATRNKNGAFVGVWIFYGDLVNFDDFDVLDDFECRQITSAKWLKIVDALYDRLYLHEWKKEYIDPSVLDGTQWELHIKLTNNRVRKYHGSNAYPPYWTELKKVFREFAKF